MLTPIQLASTWTWLGTGVSTIVKQAATKEAAAAVAKAALKKVG